MTHDEFRSQYQLLKQVTTGPVRTYQTLADAGGVVMVHFLDENAPALLERSRRLRSFDPGAIVRIDTVDGCPLVVTPFIQNFASFEGWLDLRDPAPATGLDSAPDHPGAHAKSGAQPVTPAEPPAAPPARASETPSAEPGEFTRMFGAASAHAAPPPQQPASPAEQPPPPPPALSGADEAEPGAFTRMFLRPQATDDRQHPVTPPPSSAPSAPPAAEGPGEFTRMFGHPAGGTQDPLRDETPPDADLPQPQRVVPPPPVSQEGMTQVFRSRDSAPTPGPAPSGADHRPPPTPPPPPSVQHGGPAVTPQPGEFTRMFQAAPKPHEPEPFRDPPRPRASAPEPPSGPGQFTRFFQGGGSAGTPEERREPSRPPVAPEHFGAEDDYFDRLAAGPAPSSAPPPPPAPLQSFGEAAATGPSPFTRMMQGGGGEPAPAPAPPPLTPAPAPAAKGPRPAALLALLAGVVLLTITVIVLLVAL